jgi:hypothetical protein
VQAEAGWMVEETASQVDAPRGRKGMRMKKHIKYLSYVVRHRWFVFVECCKLGIPWRGLVHDLSKFLPSEWFPYVWSFNGPWNYKERPGWLVADFDRAWLHHQHRNPHHWQYWILQNDEEGQNVLAMPWWFIYEMVADWRGAGRAQGHGDDLIPWYEKNRDKMILHPCTRANVEVLVYGPKP